MNFLQISDQPSHAGGRHSFEIHNKLLYTVEVIVKVLETIRYSNQSERISVNVKL